MFLIIANNSSEIDTDNTINVFHLFWDFNIDTLNK